MIVWTFPYTNWFSFIWITLYIFAPLVHKLFRVIPTKWRSYREHRLCDVISPYVYSTYQFGLVTFTRWGLCGSLNFVIAFYFNKCTTNKTFVLNGLQTPRMWHCFLSISEIHYSCINAIDCSGKNMSDSLLLELGMADANTYACSKELRPQSENRDCVLFCDLCVIKMYSLA